MFRFFFVSFILKMVWTAVSLAVLIFIWNERFDCNFQRWLDRACSYSHVAKRIWHAKCSCDTCWRDMFVSFEFVSYFNAFVLAAACLHYQFPVWKIQLVINSVLLSCTQFICVWFSLFLILLIWLTMMEVPYAAKNTLNSEWQSLNTTTTFKKHSMRLVFW